MSSNNEYEQRRSFDEVRPLPAKTKKAVEIIQRMPEMEHMYFVDQCAKGKMSFYDWLFSIKGRKITMSRCEIKLLCKLQKFIFDA